MNDDEINNKIKALKKQKNQNKFNKLLSLLKGKYVIFAYADSTFMDPGFDIEYYYYVNPLPLEYNQDNQEEHGGHNKDYGPCFHTMKMNAFDVKSNLTDLLHTMNYANKTVENNESVKGHELDAQWYRDKMGEDHRRNYFFFTKKQLDKIINNAPDDIQNVLKAGVRPGKFVLTHGNNDDISMFAYHD